MAMRGDRIGGELGDDVNNAAVGKDIDQDNRRFGSPVTLNFGDGQVPNRPQPTLSTDDRLQKIEFYLYGDGYTIPGVLRDVRNISEQLDTILRWVYIIAIALFASLGMFTLYLLVIR